jgi:plastocyanin
MCTQYYSIMNGKTIEMITLCLVFTLITSSIPTSHAYLQKSNQESKSHIIFITNCSVKKSCFYPCQTTIVKGTSATWINRDVADHMIISGSGQHGPDGWFSSRIISQNGVFSHTFDRKGVFTYYDSINPYSQGVIIVDSSIQSNFVKTQQSYFTDWWCAK